MDRETIEVGDGNNKQPYLFDTSNLTIIFMGAFAGLYKNKEEDKKRPIGFGSTPDETKEKKITITNDDLIKYGVPPEFLGRIPIVTNTDELSIESLVEILYKSKGGAIDEEKEFCENLGITIKFTSGYMEEIAKTAKATNTGARNLRKLVRESLASAYDEILSGKDIKVLKLTKKTALDNKKYYTE
jgi:ATP-dependent Clp protease ATP-binding subunit ClpX